MILSDSKIIEGIQDGSIFISDFDKERLNPTSYDVLLDNKMKLYKSHILDCKEKNETIEIEIGEDGCLLYPNELYLYSTEEIIGSTKYSMEIKNKSSLARLGLTIHLVASWIDVGFKGNVTLEMTVVKPLVIYPFIKIGQLVFHEIAGEVLEGYDKKKGSKYMNQSGVTESKYQDNFKQ
jgi:dCTP deaminase